MTPASDCYRTLFGNKERLKPNKTSKNWWLVPHAFEGIPSLRLHICLDTADSVHFLLPCGIATAPIVKGERRSRFRTFKKYRLKFMFAVHNLRNTRQFLPPNNNTGRQKKKKKVEEK